MQIKKLPDLAALRAKYSSLNDKKANCMRDYRQAKKQMQEYGVVKRTSMTVFYIRPKARQKNRNGTNRFFHKNLLRVYSENKGSVCMGYLAAAGDLIIGLIVSFILMVVGLLSGISLFLTVSPSVL